MRDRGFGVGALEQENRTVKSKAGILAGLVVLGVAVYLGSRLAAQQPAPAPAPPTHIGILNMVEVIKGYKKAQNMEANLRQLQTDWENKLKPFRDQMMALQNKYRNPGLPQADREQVEKEMRKVQIDFQVMEEDAKKDLMKQSGIVYQQLYREVEDAVKQFAVPNGYAVVFFYNDAIGPDEKYSAPNVTRKFSLPAAAVPMYIANQVDITAIIANKLNLNYQSAAPTTPPAGTPAPNH
jgi:Skp family chaperone for outer membrane proteins